VTLRTKIAEFQTKFPLISTIIQLANIFGTFLSKHNV